MRTKEDARALIDAVKKVPLGFYPTPFHKLERMSELTGVNLWVKREDFSGVSLFGGNKVRKLEFLLADAVRKGCDTVFTYGATESNHAMQTATAARKLGLKPVLWLGAIVEPNPAALRANMLLDRILGAEIHILESRGSTRETMEANQELFEKRKNELEKEGHRVYDIPMDGSLPRGALGFAECWIELAEQAEAAGIHPDYVYTCTGSGGTLAGLAAGRTLIGSDRTVLTGIAVGKKDPETYGKEVRLLADDVLMLLGEKKLTKPDVFQILYDYVGAGYEKPFGLANDDIRLLARTEGIFLDPVYSGKAFHGMMEEIRKRNVPQGSTVVFLHTGGATALFAEPEIIGDLSEEK